MLIPGLRRWWRLRKCFDYGNKLRALKKAYPELHWGKFRLAKGGGSIAFIVDNTIFKIRKFNDEHDIFAKFNREKRITDAVSKILPIAVPNIELLKINNYTVYKTNFIPGRVLVNIPLKKIIQNREKLAQQLTDIIWIMFNADYPELSDLCPTRTAEIGLTHGDMCSNIIVNPDTMDIVGIIDWEYACFNTLYREFFGIFRVRRKMRLTDLGPLVMWKYSQKCISE
ncbi:MAG: hypothetical protein K5912_03945 [Alphaproteobacteria bacterium]|nr:hypothetical protein [Alphaproteobacteria bacterium]